MENLNQNPMPATPNPAPSIGVKRPWQGTLLGILNIIGLVGLGLVVMAVFIGGSMLASFFPAWGFLGGFGMALGFIFMAIWILVFFITRGIFIGQKWAIIVSIVFSVLSILSTFANLSEMFFTLLLSIGTLYLGVVCLKDPYYNQG